MEFNKIFYSYIDLAGIKNQYSKSDDTFVINIAMNDYKIENNKIIIEDQLINNIIIKMGIMKNSVSEYVFLCGNRYLIVTNKKDITDRDIELSVEEFLIKRLLE